MYASTTYTHMKKKKLRNLIPILASDSKTISTNFLFRCEKFWISLLNIYEKFELQD